MKKLGLVLLLMAVGCGVRHDWMTAEILRAEDRRNAAALTAVIDRLAPADTGLAARAALATGRVPDWAGWRRLADRFGSVPAVADALAIAVRMPETGFDRVVVRRWLERMAETEATTVSLLYLDDSEATSLALSRNRFADAVAANLWRATKTMTPETVADWYRRYPSATVYSVYRLKLKGIVKADDIAGMPAFQRFYGGGVCDDPARFLADPDWRVRIAALRAVPDQVNARNLLSDPNPLVRAEALAAFGMSGGGLWRVKLDDISPMGAERLLAATGDAALARAVFDKGGRFAEVATPFMPAFETDRVMAAPVSDQRKLAFLEKTKGPDRAIAFAKERFAADRSPAALQYLLDKLPKGEQASFVETARQAGGPLLSVLDDFGYHAKMAAPQPLAHYLQELRAARQLTTFTIRTDKGDLTCRFLPEAAPLTCLNFTRLAKQGYFNGRFFHRVVPAFVAQDGDPTGTGSGGPGYSIRCEYNGLAYDRPGRIGMALAGKDTGGSQYFLTHIATPHLDHRYTIFGQVVQGLEVLDQLEQYDSIREIVIDGGDASN